MPTTVTAPLDKPVKPTGTIPNIGDWRFNRYLTMQLLPLFYVLLLAGAMVVILSIVVVCFYFSLMVGLIAAGIADCLSGDVRSDPRSAGIPDHGPPHHAHH